VRSSKLQVTNPKVQNFSARPLGSRSLLTVALTVGCFWCATAADPAGQTNPVQTSVALEALDRLKRIDLDSNAAVKAAVLKVLEQVRGRPQFVQLVRDFKITGQGPGLLEFASQNPRDPAAVDAVRLLLDQNEVQLLKNALSNTNGSGLIQAMARLNDKGILPWLSPVVTNALIPVPVRQQAVGGLSQLREGAAELLDLAKTGKLPDDLKLSASFELNQVRWPDLKAQAGLLLPLPQAADSEWLPPISELARMRGDASRGAGIFRRETLGCTKCHQVNGEGIDFGPGLSEIGAKLARDALYESILDPSAGISFGYEAWQVKLKNGDEAYGLIVSETADELAIKAVGGAVTRYKKADILQRQKQKVSIMPSGLQQAMTIQELVDLVEYLATLRVPKP